MVNEIVNGTTVAYNLHPQNKMLTHNKTTVVILAGNSNGARLTIRKSLGALPDNLSEIPGLGDLVMSDLYILWGATHQVTFTDPHRQWY
jgi:hypothetical protein